MRKIEIRRFICVTLSVLMCLGAAGCGKKDTEVVDYGNNDINASATSSNSTGSDAIFEQGNGGTLQDVFGKRVNWKDEFLVGSTTFKVDQYYEVPERDGMNVYQSKLIGDGLDEEDAIVKALFGDTAKKLEELKYTNEYDYLPMMYKYRQIVDVASWISSLEEDNEEYYSLNMSYSIINESTGETFKWKDENNLYIHMYEGMYEGKRFGLLLAYNYIERKRYIFFEPISIKEYFPEYDIKSLLVADSNDAVGVSKEYDNKCSDNIEEIKESAESLLTDTLGLGAEINVSEDATEYKYTSYDNLATYQNYAFNTGLFDPGPSVLKFSNADYISTLKDEDSGEGIDCNVLADQVDLYAEYTANNPDTNNSDMNIYSFVASSSTKMNEGVVDPEFTIDGYAVYLASEGFSLSVVDGAFYTMTSSIGNEGIIKYTSKGLYSIDISLYSKVEDVTEDVKLLDFEKIKESFSAGLAEYEGFDISRMGDPEYIEIAGMCLSYLPYFEEEGSEDFIYIPVWSLFIQGDGDGGNLATVYVNAMDGSLVAVDYHQLY